jgi:hypothetical protein
MPRRPQTHSGPYVSQFGRGFTRGQYRLYGRDDRIKRNGSAINAGSAGPMIGFVRPDDLDVVNTELIDAHGNQNRLREQ